MPKHKPINSIASIESIKNQGIRAFFEMKNKPNNGKKTSSGATNVNTPISKQKQRCRKDSVGSASSSQEKRINLNSVKRPKVKLDELSQKTSVSFDDLPETLSDIEEDHCCVTASPVKKQKDDNILTEVERALQTDEFKNIAENWSLSIKSEQYKIFRNICSEMRVGFLVDDFPSSSIQNLDYDLTIFELFFLIHPQSMMRRNVFPLFKSKFFPHPKLLTPTQNQNQPSSVALRFGTLMSLLHFVTQCPLPSLLFTSNNVKLVRNGAKAANECLLDGSCSKIIEISHAIFDMQQTKCITLDGTERQSNILRRELLFANFPILLDLFHLLNFHEWTSSQISALLFSLSVLYLDELAEPFQHKISTAFDSILQSPSIASEHLSAGLSYFATSVGDIILKPSQLAILLPVLSAKTAFKEYVPAAVYSVFNKILPDAEKEEIDETLKWPSNSPSVLDILTMLPRISEKLMASNRTDLYMVHKILNNTVGDQLLERELTEGRDLRSLLLPLQGCKKFMKSRNIDSVMVECMSHVEFRIKQLIAATEHVVLNHANNRTASKSAHYDPWWSSSSSSSSDNDGSDDDDGKKEIRISRTDPHIK